MKRIIVLLIVLFMMPMSAYASTKIPDVKKMDDDALAELKLLVDEEFSQRFDKGYFIGPGTYTCGKDIVPGIFIAYVVNVDANFGSDHGTLIFHFTGDYAAPYVYGGDALRFTLSVNEYFEIRGCNIYIMKDDSGMMFE